MRSAAWDRSVWRLASRAVSIVAVFCLAPSAFALDGSQPLPAWKQGNLDIHFISTGRGNASYIVMPDGTSLLLDAGEADPQFVASVAPLKAFPAVPDAKHSAGYWIAQYIRQFAPKDRPVSVDYALITHFHTDHMGTISPDSPMSATGAYRLAGMTEVADLIPIKTLIDRAAPRYDAPADLRACARQKAADGAVPANQKNDANSLINYLQMVAFREAHRLAVVSVHPGELNQIHLQSPQQFPQFNIRNIAASGVIWTGHGNEVQQYIPKDAIKDCLFDENPFSIVLKISYGKFQYYTGGDIPGVPDYMQPYWRDIETPVAAVVGPVDAMTLDHHGNRDATNGAMLRALRPRVIVQQNWLSAQPGEEVVVRMASHEFYPGPRDVFATGMSPETRIAIGPLMDQIYKSYEGHIVIRVAPGGANYEVFILNDQNETREIIKRFGLYEAVGL